ncbi:MAG: peptidase glycoprotease [Bacteroidota bacterium]|nr:peptidase glycoprotease [Bacteroidota bacterium]
MKDDLVYILCIEVANSVTSVAISENGKCIYTKEIAEENKAADKLHLLINDLLTSSNLLFSQLHAVAISSGPGSYTGLRIATSAAKGFCFALDIPMIAISTFEAMVYGVQERYRLADIDQYVPMIDARRMEVFTSFYKKDLSVTQSFTSLILDEKASLLFDANQDYLLFGNGAKKAKMVLSGNKINFFDDYVPAAHDLCLLAYKAFNNNNFVDIAYFEPQYLKAFYSTEVKL